MGVRFFHKHGGLGKTGGSLKKRCVCVCVCVGGGGVSLIFTLTNPFQCYLSVCEVRLSKICLFIPFVPVFFVFHEKNFVLLNIIERYAASTSE